MKPSVIRFSQILFLIGLCAVEEQVHAVPIEAGQTLTGTISASHQTNIYTFVGNAGESVVISAAHGSGNLSAWTELYDPSGKWIGQTVLGTWATTNLTLRTTGTYTIRFHDMNSNGTGDYAMSLVFVTGRGGTTLTAGQTTTNRIHYSGQTNPYVFSGNAGESVVISASHGSGNLTACADLYDPTGRWVGETVCGATTNLALATTGTYTIRLHDKGYLGTGDYAMSLVFVTGRGGTTLTAGQTTTNRIHYSGQTNPYIFSGNAGESVVISVARSSGNLTACADLYDPTGRWIGQTASGSGATTNLALATAGTYTIRFHDTFYLGTGNYGMSLVFVTGRGGTTLAAGQTTTNTIHYVGQTNPYIFNGNAGESVVISAEAESGFMTAWTELYDPTGRLVGQTMRGSGATTNLTLATTGIYTIRFHDYHYTHRNNYGMSLIFVTGRGGTTLAAGQTTTNTIRYAGQTDSYIFNGNAGESVVISAEAESGFMTAWTELYDPTGRLVGQTVRGSGATTNLTLATTGTYTIRFHDYHYTHRNNYGLSLVFVTGRGGTALASGEMTTNTIRYVGQTDPYTFSGSAGESVVISVRAASGNLRACAELYDPTGRWVGQTVLGSGSTTNLALVTAGTYTIRFHDYHYTQTGGYILGVIRK